MSTASSVALHAKTGNGKHNQTGKSERVSGKSVNRKGMREVSGFEMTGKSQRLQSGRMQRMVGVSWSAEEYAAGGLERTLGRPESCPRCAKRQSLEAHGYYERWVSGGPEVGRLVRIRVRRFFAAGANGP